MKTKIKTTIIALSTAAIVTPIASIVCLANSSKNTKSEDPKQPEYQTQKLNYSALPSNVDMNAAATPASAKNNSASNIELSLNVTNLDDNVKVQYRHGDGVIWKHDWKDLTVTTAVTLCPNEVVQFRGYCPTAGILNKANGDGLNIAFTSALSSGIELGGNIMSLLCSKSDYTECLESVTQSYCFNGLFKNSAALTSVPTNFLPSMITKEGCYQSLFENCINLNRAPSLPSTTMSKYAYRNMFKGCSNLFVAPSLPSLDLADGCYESIFEGCISLTSISLCYFGNIVDKYFLNWVNNVNSIGKFYYNGAENSLTGLIPTNFEVVRDSEFKQSTYFKNNLKEIEFKADKATAKLQGGAESIKIICKQTDTIQSLIDTEQIVPSKTSTVPAQHQIAYVNSSNNSGLDSTKTLSEWPNKVTIKYGFNPIVNPSYINLHSNADFSISFRSVAKDCTLWYSTNEGSDWNAIDTKTTTNFNKDVHYVIKGTIGSTSESNYTNIKISGSKNVHLSGNIMALIQNKGVTPKTITTDFAFYKLFYDSTAIKDIADDFLPSTTVTNMCYASMFEGCTNLTTAPALPATALAAGCYYRMFYGCTNLIKTPTMSGTAFADPYTTSTGIAAGCYREMFYDCKSLTTATSMPSVTMGKFGCYGMFQNCESLTSLPTSLPAESLADNCYQHMFNGCTSLTKLPTSFLPATTLADHCYEYMFLGCASLTTPMTNLPAGGEDETINAYAYRQMFKDCTSLTRTPLFHGIVRSDRNKSKYEDEYTNFSLGYIKDYAMESMFENCKSLTIAENIANNELKDYTFRYMFKGCKSLRQPPYLTYLKSAMGKNCYQEMFAYCSNMTVGWSKKHQSYNYGRSFFDASFLLSGDNNYKDMFIGCKLIDFADSTPEYKTEYHGSIRPSKWETAGHYFSPNI